MSDWTRLHVVHTIVAGTEVANDLPDAPEGRELARVWTLIDAPLLRRLGPMHNQSAFLEDRIHDYVVRDGKLHYYSRVVEKGHSVQIVLDYETTLERTARLEDMGRRAGPSP